MAHIHGPEPHFTDPLAAVQIKLYKDAYTELLQLLADGIRTGRSVRFAKYLLADVGRILGNLRTTTQAYTLGPGGDWQRSTLRKAMLLGEAEAVKDATRQGITLSLDTGFAKINEYAVQVVARNLAFDLFAGIDQVERRVVQFIGRSTNDIFRQAQLNAIGRRFTQGLTIKQAKGDMIAQLVDNGIPAFTDTKGRNWSLPSYSEMAVRTVSREAATLGALGRFQDGGLDLVKITTHFPTCKLCASLQGRVFSVSGNSGGYPKLERHPPFHPNCGHVASAYVPAMDKNAEETKAFSNRPVEDDRTEKEVAEYERQQAVKNVQRERRQVMAQLKAKAVPVGKRMQNWADELAATGTSPARRKELQGLMADHTKEWEKGRRERYKELGTRLKDLKEAK